MATLARRCAGRILSGVSPVPLAIAFGATSIPVATALIAAAFAARLGGGALARPGGAPRLLGARLRVLRRRRRRGGLRRAYGWSPVTFRIYYLAGGVLAVGLLGLGATWLHARRDLALFASGAVLATLDRGRDRACSARVSTPRSSRRAACARRPTAR